VDQKINYLESLIVRVSKAVRKKIDNLSARYGISTNSETNKKNLRNFGTAAKKPPKIRWRTSS